jgi:hypothetical protein
MVIALRLLQRRQQQKDHRPRQRDAGEESDPAAAGKGAVHGAILLLVSPYFKL